MINNNKNYGARLECDRDEIFIKFISPHSFLIELAFYDHKQS